MKTKPECTQAVDFTTSIAKTQVLDSGRADQRSVR